MTNRSLPVHIALASDAGYAQHLGITVLSVMKSTERPTNLVFHVIDCGLGERNRQRLFNMVNGYNGSIHFYPLSVDKYACFPLMSHVTAAAYARFELPNLLPLDVGRVIYLDSDLLVLQDIAELWQFDLKGLPLGAVLEPEVSNEERLGLPIGTPYFNSGVLVMDLRQFRIHGFMEKAEKFVCDFPERIKYVDQDALNVILASKWLSLPSEWNYVAWHYTPEARLNRTASPLKRSPCIVHFTASPKPWQYACDHPWRWLYLKYLAESPWLDYKFPDRSIGNVIRKHVRATVPLRLRVAIRKWKNR